MAAGCLTFIGLQKHKSIARLLEQVQPSGPGFDSRSDVFTNVDSSYIDYGCGCLVSIIDNLLEKKHSDVQVLH